MDERTQSAAPRTQQILKAGSLDSLLLTDLASDGDASPQVQARDELGEGAEHAAVAHRLSVLPEDVTRAEVGDDACKEEGRE